MAIICAVGWMIWQADRKLSGPAAELHTALALDLRILSATGDIGRLAVLAHHSAQTEPPAEFFDAAERLNTALAEYRALPLNEHDRQALETVALLAGQLTARTEQFFRTNLSGQEGNNALLEIWDLRRQVGVVMRSATGRHVDELAAASLAVQGHLRNLALLILATLLYVVLEWLVLRRARKQGIWEPLEQLRRMMQQVRRGDFELREAAPASVELGPLFESFTQMAGEVHATRANLERLVEERTVQLNATQRQLYEAQRMTALGQLVSGVAHEVNNPLTGILGFAEVLAENPRLGAQEQHYVATIRAEALRVKKVVANLSAFARQGRPRTHRLDLRTLLGRIVELQRYHLAASKIRVHFRQDAPPLWVRGDPDQLTQLVFNLVQNAELAVAGLRPQGGDIWIEGQAANGHVRLEVRDNGRGMSPEVRDRAFEPFFTTRPVGQGMGLGLSVAHGIARQHGGRIEIESTPGEGTTVRVLLPASADAGAANGSLAVQAGPELFTAPSTPAAEAASLSAPGEAAAAPAPPATPAAAPARQALVIDDEEGILSLVGQVLRRRGFECVTLGDSRRLEEVLERGFDVVLCDLKMPHRTGLEVYRMLEARAPRLARRFLLMTGNLADAEEQEVVSLGLRTLRKPFSLAQLMAAVNRVLEEEN